MPTKIRNDIEAGLRELLTELREQRQEQERPRAPALSRRDRALLGQLLPAAAGAIGSEPFTVAELFEIPATSGILGSRSPAHVGRLLQRAIGIPIDGYLVERCPERELHRHLWRVVATMSDRSSIVAPRADRHRVE